MEKQKTYNIVISTGELNNNFLEAEIYTNTGVYITSVANTGKNIVLDFTCEAMDEVCKGKKEISLNDFIEAINESLKSLEVEVSIQIQQKGGSG
jgi:hypothetical protein